MDTARVMDIGLLILVRTSTGSVGEEEKQVRRQRLRFEYTKITVLPGINFKPHNKQKSIFFVIFSSFHSSPIFRLHLERSYAHQQL